MTDKLIWGLIGAAQVGAASQRRIYRYLEHHQMTLAQGWANLATWGRVVKLPADKLARLLAVQKEWPLERWQAYLAKMGWQICVLGEANFPRLLAHIPDFPVVLFYQGQIEVLQGNSLAVVGARRMTHYGRAVIEELLDERLCQVTIVSGLMTGVDVSAHSRALAIGAPTAAFLGYGLELTWPAGARECRAQILAAGGAIISEFAPWEAPVARNFPIRNRLVAGSTCATLVIEAAVRSGSLITANLAADYGREVMAVPGSIFNERSVGCLELIAQGATMVRTSQQIGEVLQNLGVAVAETGKEASAGPTKVVIEDEWQKKVLELLQAGPAETEQLVAALGDQQAVATACTWLELMGEIARDEAGRWQAS
ncbi:DNA-processing protein DprA [bacterium]|nr:DNA-processing protein DprA [bacterium]